MSTSLFALFDDVASIMDDVAVMSKVAIKKSAGVTGDDFAVSVNQVNGITSSRELPVIWKIVKGSLFNKMILLVVLLAIAYFLPILIPYILILGACYLAYEGAEKVLEKIGFHVDDEESNAQTEDEKIKSALRTDMVLSAEIMVIALGATIGASFMTQIVVLSAVAIVITFVIYGIVTLLIRLDDMGFALVKTGKPTLMKIGDVMVTAAPKIMRILSVVGTVAMFMVAGGIFIHNVETIHHFTTYLSTHVNDMFLDVLVGLTAGLCLTLPVMVFKKIRTK